MAASKRPAKKPGAPSVEAFLAALDHPRKQDILTVRQIILGADPRIQEAIKWNAPSFHILLGAAPLEQSRFALRPHGGQGSGSPAAPKEPHHEHFATFHLRSRHGVEVILHRGAKKREGEDLRVPDPGSLLVWLGPDRATLRLADARAIEARREAIGELIRAWIPHV